MKDDLAATASDAGWNDILEAWPLKLQNRLSPLLRSLTFIPNKRSAALLGAINHFRNDGDLSAIHAPVGFLDATQKAALVRDDGTFRVSLYKVFLFQAVTTAIKSGGLNVEQSYKYRPMDAYLIEKERWHREKTRLLERAGLTEFSDPEPVLTSLSAALTAQYQATNGRAAGNSHLRLRKDGTFHIATPAIDAREADPLGDLFPQRHNVALAQVLETINNHCNMIADHSPMSWAHINMLDEYDFSEEKLRDTLGILPPKMAA